MRIKTLAHRRCARSVRCPRPRECGSGRVHRGAVRHLAALRSFAGTVGSVARRAGGARLTGGPRCVPARRVPFHVPARGVPMCAPARRVPFRVPARGVPICVPVPGAPSRVPASPEFPVHNPGRSEVRPGRCHIAGPAARALGSPTIRRSASGRERAHQSIGNRMAAFRVIG